MKSNGHLMKRILSLLAAAVFVFLSMPAFAAQADSYAAKVTVDTGIQQGDVSRTLFGAIQRWNRYGEYAADPVTGLPKPEFIEACRQLGVTNIRYEAGNIGAMGFLFDRCIGPMENRTNCYVKNNLIGQFPAYGPDEMGVLIDELGISASLVLNSHRASLQENVNYVSYMMYPSNGEQVDINHIASWQDEEYYDPQYWGNLRASIGHKEPYRISMCTFGNEEDMGNGWKYEQLVRIGDHPAEFVLDESKQDDVIAALYTFGGTITYEKKMVAGYADLDKNANIATGEPDQTYYAYYRHVDEGTPAHVYVNDEEWAIVDDLAGAGAQDKVCTLESHFGEIRFGDGVHGAIPEQGAAITLTAVDTHEGYLATCDAIHAIFPDLIIGTAFMGDGLNDLIPYCKGYDFDLASNHALTLYMPASRGSSPYNETLYYQYMAAARIQGQRIEQIQARMEPIMNRIPDVALTAWGRTNGFYPEGFDDKFMITMDGGMLCANQLLEFIRVNVRNADIFQLNDTPWDPAPWDGVVGSQNESVILLNEKNNDAFLSPKGWAFSMFAKMAGQTIVKTGVETPSVELELINRFPRTSVENPCNTLDMLKAVSTVDEAGNLLINVINNSYAQECTVQFDLGGYQYQPAATVTILTSESTLDMNTLEEQDKIVPRAQTVTVGENGFELTIPAHAVVSVALEAKVQ